jgi:hypothetical protein
MLEWSYSTTINKYTNQGNLFLNKDGLNITVFRRKLGWSYRVVKKTTKENRETVDELSMICPNHRYYKEQEEAKDAAIKAAELLSSYFS